MKPIPLMLLLWFFQSLGLVWGKVERVWLSYADEQAKQVAVQWETSQPVVSKLRFRTASSEPTVLKQENESVRHCILIPLGEKNARYHYEIWDGKEWTQAEFFDGIPTKDLKLVFIGDLGYAKRRDLSAILKEEPHVIVTLGDNVPSLHEEGREGIKAYRALVDEFPELFRRYPFMPINGNHDHGVKPRGSVRYPQDATYDIQGTAYREFFALPGVEWIWELCIEEFNLRLLALSLHHLSDFGTTWQTTRAWHKDSEQFQWYQSKMVENSALSTFTLLNENIRFMENKANDFWKTELLKSDAIFSGFGYFGDRAILGDRVPYYNSCLKGDGDLYLNPKSQFHTQEDNYLVIQVPDKDSPVQVTFKRLSDGKALDGTFIPRRSTSNR